MSVWALADLHLAVGVPEKTMDVFGAPWVGYMDKIATHWRACIHPNDLVLLAGDISWAMRLPEVEPDLAWIEALPGTKVMLRGNHDFWWTSLKQIEKILPPSIHLIQNNAYVWKDYVIGGTRLWDTSDYQFRPYIQYAENPRARKLAEEEDHSPDAEKIYQRELGRLELSLKEMAKYPGKRLVMTHYPPISADLQPSKVSALLEQYGVDICVFGHLHNVRHDVPLFGSRNGVTYHLTSADNLDFKPLKITN